MLKSISNRVGASSILRAASTVFVFIFVLSLSVFAQKGGSGGQASLTLSNADAKLCYVQDNAWTITKTTESGPIVGSGDVSWTVTATKTPLDPTFAVHGGLAVTNTGSAPATIGNIIINVQRKVGNKWVSAGVALADATLGDAAAAANCVAASSAEANNPPSYTVTGAKGTFQKTPGATLNFTDASNNTVFSVTPKVTIPVGATVTLLYHAGLPASIAAANTGQSLRVETLVTFGNSGARGGSGATATNIDIDGSGSLSADEANVRTVPVRVTTAPVALIPANDSVTVTDAGSVGSGDVSVDSEAGFDQFPATVSATTSWTVSASVSTPDGSNGGKVCNTASLAGTAVGGTLGVILGYNVDLTPIYATYTCADAADASASSCVDVTAKDIPPPPPPTKFCSFSQGGYGGRGEPFDLLAAGFPSGGFEVGIPGSAGFSMKFTSAAAVQAYLPAGGSSGALTVDLLNPTSTSAGNFGGQLLALKISVGLSDANALPYNGLGDLYYKNPGDSLHGKTVREILAAAETALGGGALPSGYTFTTLSDLIANLNLSYDNPADGNPCGTSTPWADAHLQTTMP